MTLPVLPLRGTPFEQGRQHGAGLRERIAHNLAVYFDRFEREVGLARREALAQAASFLPVIERMNPDYLSAMQGVAQGSGQDLPSIAALNMRYEILYYQFGVKAVNDGCTSFAVMPEQTANGHLWIGQNWDWIPQVQGAMLHTVEAGGLATLSFTEAGIVGGKIGLNSAGLGLLINGLTAMSDDVTRECKPFHVRCYEILRSTTIAQAKRIITESSRACSTNYLIAQAPDQIVDLEAAPDSFRQIACENGCVAHTNHFLDPGALGISEPPNEHRPYSCFRLERMRSLLRAAEQPGLGEFQSFLRDHDNCPYSICRHEDPKEPSEEHYSTVCSVIMDLSAQRLHVADGKPCESEYEALGLQGL